MTKSGLFSIVFCLGLFACKDHKKIVSGGIPPEQALSTFELADGFQIELIAAEPLISDPVAMDLDEQGNIYVVEMHGYPLDKSGSGVIKKLTDSNGDGRPDKSTVFADQLVLPTGIMRWKKGFLVVDVPHVLYLEDTDGDHKADIRDILITGFAVTNPQHIANTPVFGLDNWIYLAHQGAVNPKVFPKEFGDTGSAVLYPAKTGAPVLPADANGRNVRFKPDEDQLEMMAGESQYGQTFDHWGHQFLTSNAEHLFSEILAARYLQRNPALLVAEATENIPDHGNACEVYPITQNPEHQLLTDVGVVTSSCGVTWYNGGLFPDSFSNVTFIAEPVHNLVHADRVLDRGASFTASRIYNQKEFLASRDAWFRPCQFYIGPDGALFVLDYYRQIIEHPEWMSDEVNKSGALYNGSRQGRIYRITPSGTPAMDWCGKLNLESMGMEQLVALLDHKNNWWRRQAQRLLLDKKDTASGAWIRNALLEGKLSAVGTVHALWTLQGLKQLVLEDLTLALKHSHARVRENAIRLAEDAGMVESLLNVLVKMDQDPDSKVRFQLACTLGGINHPEAKKAIRNILLRDIEDKWVQTAALTAAGSLGPEMAIEMVTLLGNKETRGGKQFFEQLGTGIALKGESVSIIQTIALATRSEKETAAWWKAALLNGLYAGIRNNKPDPASRKSYRDALSGAFQQNSYPEIRTAAVQLLTVLGLPEEEQKSAMAVRARMFITNPSSPASLRRDALKILGLNRDTVDIHLIQRLLSPGETDEIQEAALQAYSEIAPQAAWTYSLEHWKNLTPAVRETALQLMVKSPPGMFTLLKAVEQDRIQKSSIGWPRTVRLMNSYTDSIRTYARKLLGHPEESRNAVYEKYQAALPMEGDPVKGQSLFMQHCAICHQVNGALGKAIGPDLATIRNREAGFILADILDPNRSIADEYQTWTIEKKNGEKFSGVISTQTQSSLALTDATGTTTLIARVDIRLLESAEMSMMPVGLEGNLTVEEMAGLLAFLKGK